MAATEVQTSMRKPGLGDQEGDTGQKGCVKMLKINQSLRRRGCGNRPRSMEQFVIRPHCDTQSEDTVGINPYTLLSVQLTHHRLPPGE